MECGARLIVLLEPPSGSTFLASLYNLADFFTERSFIFFMCNDHNN